MNKKYVLFVSLSILVIASLAAGCAQAAPVQTVAPAGQTAEAPTKTVAPPAPNTAFPVTLQDALGRSVTLETAPQRIVVAGKASTLITDALYMFPEAVDRVISYGKGTQTGIHFLSVVDQRSTIRPVLRIR